MSRSPYSGCDTPEKVYKELLYTIAYKIELDKIAQAIANNEPFPDSKLPNPPWLS